MALPYLAYAAPPPDTQPDHTQVKGDALRAVFDNTKVLSEYRNFKGIHENGYDFTEFHHRNGTTSYTEIGAKTERGLWKIIGEDKICYTYPNTDAFTQTYCFFVYQQDKCYYNYSLNAMTIHGPRNWSLWTSRFVREGDGGSCADPVG